MVCEHGQRQPAECMEDSIWGQHIPGRERYKQTFSWSFYSRLMVINGVIHVAFTSCSRRSRPRSSAATSQPMTNTSWRDLATRRPPSMRSSTREEKSTSYLRRLTVRLFTGGLRYWRGYSSEDVCAGMFFHPFCCGGFILGYIFVCVPNPFLNYLGATVEAVLRFWDPHYPGVLWKVYILA